MTRHATLLVAALLAAGCGSVEPAGEGAPSTQAPRQDTSSRSLEPPDPSKVQAPRIFLESAAGRQEALTGSSCVNVPDRESGAGIGVCRDTVPLEPELLSVVRPGEELAIVLGGHARIVSGSLRVFPLGCQGPPVLEATLEPGEKARWRADLPAGSYELEVSAGFEGPEGLNGDVSGSLGIFVDDSVAAKILPAPDNVVGCPQG